MPYEGTKNMAKYKIWQLTWYYFFGGGVSSKEVSWSSKKRGKNVVERKITCCKPQWGMTTPNITFHKVRNHCCPN